MFPDLEGRPAMLDTPKTSEKSHADGKILQRVDDGVGIIIFRIWNVQRHVALGDVAGARPCT